MRGDPTPQAAASDAVFSHLTESYELMKATRPDMVAERAQYASQHAYQNVPILKRPFWGWEIAVYFFVEGISAGAFILCTAADLVDSARFRNMVRISRYLSFLLVIPCPPLLVVDLGRPERFHHMLRVVKRSSPMNIGAWALTVYGTLSFVAAALEVPARKLPFGQGTWKLFQRFVPKRLVGLSALPFAYTMVAYPGVLLSTTAIPAWAHTHFLGALFSASSLSSATAALTLCASATGDHDTHRILETIEDAAAAAESAALITYLSQARGSARPLTHGKLAKLFWWGAVAVGIAAPALMRRSRSKALRTIVAPLLTLAGAAALKWAVVHAGQQSALDREGAIHNAAPETWDQYWGQRSSRAGEPGKRLA